MKRYGLAEGFLFTDFYEFTMAQLYFREGLSGVEARFEYFFRDYPSYNDHRAGYCVNAGLEWLAAWMRDAEFTPEDRKCLEAQKGRDGRPVFSPDFLDWMEENGDFSGISLRAVPEGRVVHPGVPCAVVTGPVITAQILESSLLNHLNYQTLIATKACRVKEAGGGNTVIEFGLRRAQATAANAGARAALIGGADFSSNTGISCCLGHPPKGTHAHSMVQMFLARGGSELDAFRAYADAYPDDCLLLVDTIDTLASGLPNAIRVFTELREKGHEPAGVRLDSGDLAYLSIEAAKMLDGAGFEGVPIVLSNKLDELVLWQILTQIRKEAPRRGLDPEKLISRLVYGVGTSLITSAGDPALDGVYKLTAVQGGSGWSPAFKLSDSVTKAVNPGRKNVWRIYDRDMKAVADLITLEDEDPREMDEIVLRHPVEPSSRKVIGKEQTGLIEPLLADMIEKGELVREFPPITDIRKTRDKDLAALHEGVKRVLLPHKYHVSLSQGLWDLKQRLIEQHGTVADG